MGHAVHIWGHQCATGQYRIFSITWEGQPEATMAIQNKKDQWVLNQVVGPRFTKASPDSQKAAQEMADLYTQAWARNPDHHQQEIPAA